MVDDIKDWDSQLSEIISVIRKGVDSVSSLKGKEKEKVVDDLQGRIQRAKELYQQYKVALRELSKNDAVQWERKSKDYNNAITQLIADLNFAKNEAERNQLMAGGNNIDNMEAKEIITAASNIQDESLNALGRINKQINNAQQIGTDITIELETQNTQLKNIKENIDSVQSNLKQADKQIRAFMRRVMTDKLILVLMLLVFIGVVVAIIVGATGHGGSTVNTSVANNFNPNGFQGDNILG